ncbi:MAG: dTDP-4-amino-4,6-dideoxygalactose transaminase [Bacteroidales bacterium]|nr:dTDP-4-amino-4,6-dideoxygalactose transaminase [Bacteroidales bacterium]MDD4603538.1 dTDP-4-amino-4,6-dideoxygalactose transaminase [Bacteroidales bacterium]
MDKKKEKINNKFRHKNKIITGEIYNFANSLFIMFIPFNKPYLPLSSMKTIMASALSGTIAGNGRFTKKCHRFFEDRFGFGKVLLTTSCTDALEMASLLCRIEPGDEVILPSFTFMSTANPFLLRGANLVFADTLPDVPNIDPEEIEKLVTPRSKVIVVVHYGGFACDMDRIMEIAQRHHLWVVEDAAHAVDSYYRGKPLGSIGNFGAFSFHETKNIISGEGGLLIINDENQRQRAEIIWEKGTNRASFYRGEIDKYGWVDLGSSYLPSDTIAAFLWTQLNHFNRIQNRRKKIWWLYYELLRPLEDQGYLKCPVIPDYATVNGNLFYFTVSSLEVRDCLLKHLKNNGIQAVFHYLPLHSSAFFKNKYTGPDLPNTNRFSNCIIRLPFFYSLRNRQMKFVVNKINDFFLTR